MDAERNAGDDFAATWERGRKTLSPSPRVRARLLEALERTPQVGRAPQRRPWFLATAAAGLVAAALLALGSRTPPAPRNGPVASPPEHDGAGARRAPWEEPPEVTRTRALNEACYERERERLRREGAGRWVVIAQGRAEVLAAGAGPRQARTPAGEHAFVFEVGTDGPRREETFYSWYATRFAGGGLARALGLRVTLAAVEGTFVAKEGHQPIHGHGAVFPRVPFDLSSPRLDPSGNPKRAPGMEVFLGSLGPPLMLTPEDVQRLELWRSEIPGEVSYWEGGRCRQGLVQISVAGWNEPADVVALWPLESHDVLVERARGRHRFWYWGGDLPRLALGIGAAWPNTPAFLLFGRDRVLARAASQADLLAWLAADEDVNWHAFVLEEPAAQRIAERLVLSTEVASAAPHDLVVSDRERGGHERTVRARGVGPTGPFLLDAAVGPHLGLERAEEAREVILRAEDGSEVTLRGGYAWVRPAVGSGAVPQVALLAYPLPPAPPAPVDLPAPAAPGVPDAEPAQPQAPPR